MKEILETSGLQVSAGPNADLDQWSAHLVVSSRPQAASFSPLATRTTLITPAGIPTRSAKTHMARALKGVSAGALMTHVQPAAKAGATLRVIMALGKFLHRVRRAMSWHRSAYQGVMRPQTPMGCLMMVFLVPGNGAGTVWPYALHMRN